MILGLLMAKIVTMGPLIEISDSSLYIVPTYFYEESSLTKFLESKKPKPVKNRFLNLNVLKPGMEA